ncbi:hypothetical protein [Clostridium thailandense]
MCECAKYDSEKEIYNCKIIEGECLFISPDQKTCDETFGSNEEEAK